VSLDETLKTIRSQVVKGSNKPHKSMTKLSKHSVDELKLIYLKAKDTLIISLKKMAHFLNIHVIDDNGKMLSFFVYFDVFNPSQNSQSHHHLISPFLFGLICKDKKVYSTSCL